MVTYCVFTVGINSSSSDNRGTRFSTVVDDVVLSSVVDKGYSFRLFISTICLSIIKCSRLIQLGASGTKPVLGEPVLIARFTGDLGA